MKKTILIFALLLFNIACKSQSDTTVQYKTLISANKFTFPIGNVNCKQCIGYTNSDAPGPQPRAAGIILQEDSAVVIDASNHQLIKINIKTGKVVRKYKLPKDSIFEGASRELIYFENKILLLSYTGTLYIFNMDLSLQKQIEMPVIGIIWEFFNYKSNLYIRSDRYIRVNKETIGITPLFFADENIHLHEDTIFISKKEYYNDTLMIYGKNTGIYEKGGRYFFKTNEYIFETPELIPQIQDYYKSVGYNDKYLVYFTLHKGNYEMTVCKYW